MHGAILLSQISLAGLLSAIVMMSFFMSRAPWKSWDENFSFGNYFETFSI